MQQEESNGEASFEMIDKKNDEANNQDKTESLSSVSSPYSIPSPSVVNLPGGNLLSNLPPPSNLPDFTLWSPSQGTANVLAPTPLPSNLQPITSQNQVDEPKNVDPGNIQPMINEPFITTEFSAAIPPSKGVQHGPPLGNNINPSTQPNASGFIGWMKDAVSSGGILSKVAEKAKSSVDSLITTLDPQMTEFIYTGGDTEIALATQNPEEITPVREAIYHVFGKAWVNGVHVEDKPKYPIGFENAIKNVEEKINASFQIQKVPTVAIENFILVENKRYFHSSVMMLKDVARDVSLHTFSQTTQIPVEDFITKAQKVLPTLSKSSDEDLLASYIPTLKNTWQQEVSGVPQKEILFMAAKSLIGQYKRKLTNS